jgi:flagellar biosynthesis protein FliP
MTKLILVLALALMFVFSAGAIAQNSPTTPLSLLQDQALSQDVSGRIFQNLTLLTLLSVLPALLIMATSFTRIIIALSFLRSSIGLQTTPANIVMLTLALFLTFFIMTPTVERALNQGFIPYSEQKIPAPLAYERITAPFREFMLKNVREKELSFFTERASQSGLGNEISQQDFRVIVPAFLVSELRRGFEIGFLIALPFLVIDIVVATVTMSMGMMMLPPTVISLPFKVLFFILIDGWTLLAGSLIDSFN